MADKQKAKDQQQPHPPQQQQPTHQQPQKETQVQQNKNDPHHPVEHPKDNHTQQQPVKPAEKQQPPQPPDELQSFFLKLLLQHELTIEAADMLQKKATGDSELIPAVFKAMHDHNKSLQSVKDHKKIEELLPLIYEQTQVFSELRTIFGQVMNLKKPEKFEARLLQSRDYGHKIKIAFQAIDALNTAIFPKLPHLASKEITLKLEKQFDHLQQYLLDIFKDDDFEIESAVEEISKNINKVPVEQLKKILVEIKKSKNRSKHNIVRGLQSWDTIKKQKEEEGLKKVELIKKNSKHLDLPKFKKAYEQDLESLKQFLNKQASQFFLTFYNPQKDHEIGLDNFIQTFILYFKTVTQRVFELSNQNQALLIQAIDPLDLVTVSIEEIDMFFEKYVDAAEKKITIDGFKFDDENTQQFNDMRFSRRKVTEIVYLPVPKKPKHEEQQVHAFQNMGNFGQPAQSGPHQVEGFANRPTRQNDKPNEIKNIPAGGLSLMEVSSSIQPNKASDKTNDVVKNIPPPPNNEMSHVLNPAEMIDNEMAFNDVVDPDIQIAEQQKLAQQKLQLKAKEELEKAEKLKKAVPKTFKVKMTVLEDFDDELEASKEKRKTNGILKCGQQREFEIQEGQYLSFGKDPISDVVIPLDDIDEKAFVLTNKHNELVLVDQSINVPTKIKVDPERGYRLNFGDYIDLGLDQLLHIQEATSKYPPNPTNEKVYDIRCLPKGISKIVDQQLQSNKHETEQNQDPSITIEYKGGQENGQTKTLTKGQVPSSKYFLLGRHNTSNIVINNKMEGVSKKHCRIKYKDLYGWVLYDGSEDAPSTCGTWVHPKTWTQAYDNKKNSTPVQVYNEMIVKVGTFTLQFNISQIELQNS